jgi:hypothetical protein
VSNEHYPEWINHFYCRHCEGENFTYSLTRFSNTGVRTKDATCNICGQQYLIKWLEDSAIRPAQVDQVKTKKRQPKRHGYDKGKQPKLF